MLPVVEPDGLSTAWRIIAYSVFLIPVSLLPSFVGMSGRIYWVGALLLGIGLLGFGVRLTRPKMPVASAASKLSARQLLQATVVYLPILFVIMMTDVKR